MASRLIFAVDCVEGLHGYLNCRAGSRHFETGTGFISRLGLFTVNLYLSRVKFWGALESAPFLDEWAGGRVSDRL